MQIDLATPLGLTIALGPDLILMGGAILLLLWAAWRPPSPGHQRAVGIASLLLTLITAGAVIYYVMNGIHAGSAGGIVALDNFRWAADLIFLIGTVLTISMALDYNTREGIHAAESHVLVLFATSGMMLLAGARDLIVIFLGIEIMSVSSYALTAMNRRSARAAEGALKYFLLGAFSTAILLYGIALVYGATGATHLDEIRQRITEFDLLGSPLLLSGLALLLVGFGFKVALAPFHMWAPDVYEGAPTPFTAYMAAAVKAGAFAAFLRVWLEAFPAAWEAWRGPVVALAIITMVAGNLIALAQRNIKRLLAYSSIAHAGYVLVALAVGTSLGIGAFLFYLFAYTLATMGAFAVVVAVGSAGEPHLRVEDYSGLWGVRPWMAGAMTVFMLALLGFPIFGGIGFLAKWYVLEAAVRAPRPEIAMAVVLVLTSVVSAGYYLYVVMVMFMRPRPESAVAPATDGRMTRLVVGATAALILILGIMPQPLIRAARMSTLAPAQTSAAQGVQPEAAAR